MTAAVDDGEAAARRAFVGLLVRPMITPATAPDLLREVSRYASRIEERARRLGYRCLRMGAVTRLVRLPLAGSVTAPPRPVDAPTRQVLALTCVLAAACEEARTVATLAELSGLVTDLSGADLGADTHYDQGLQVHRRMLVRAADALQHWGVVTRVDQRADAVDVWTDTGSGIGRVYQIDREALLLFISPDVLAAVTAASEPDYDLMVATRSVRALRALVETPAVCYADLAVEEAEVLRGTRGLRSAEATGLVGGTVEARREGLMLLLPDEPPSPAGIDWPRAESVAFGALLLLDAITRRHAHDDDGVILVAAEQLPGLVEALITHHGRYVAGKLRSRPATLQTRIERQLVGLGLIRVESGSWRVSPVVGRFRGAEVTLPDASDPPEDRTA